MSVNKRYWTENSILEHLSSNLNALKMCCIDEYVLTIMCVMYKILGQVQIGNYGNSVRNVPLSSHRQG